MPPTRPASAARRRSIGARVLGTLCLLAAPAAGAQELRFRHIGADDGLPSSLVSAVVQDARGFMWIGTANGLSRYDGVSFHSYRRERGNPRSLAGNFVNRIYRDRRGTLWVGTPEGLSRYDETRDDFANYLAPTDDGVRHSVWGVAEDSAGTLWVGTSRGLYRFDPAREVATPVALPPAAGGAPANVQTVHASRGTVWVGTTTGLYAFAPGSAAPRRYTHDPADSGSLPDDNVRSLNSDAAGALWVGMEQGGLARLDAGTQRFVGYRHDPADPSSLARNKVITVDPDRVRPGGVWVGTENGGLDYLAPAAGRRFVHHQFDANDPSGLNSNSIWSLYQEASGALWVGTFSGGVNVSALNGAALRRFRSTPGDPTSLSYDAVPAFAEDGDGAVWVTTDGGGLNRLDPATGRFTRYTSRTTNLNSDAVLGVMEGRRGDLWVATWAGGISRFDRRTGRFTAYTTANSNLPDNQVYEVVEDRSGRMWIGTDNAHVALFDRERGAVTRDYTVVPPGLPPSSVLLLRLLSDGRFAVGLREGGVTLLDPETGRQTHHRFDPRVANTIASNNVRALLEGEPGVLWVGTDDGLDRLDLATGRATHFGEADGLPGNDVLGILPDADGRLWVSTNQGVARLDPRSHAVKTFTRADGLQGSEFLMRSAMRARDGTLYFGGTGGFTAIRPDLLVENTRRPPVELTGFQLFNKPVAVGAPGSPLAAPIGRTRELTLGYRQNVLTFEFAALDFAAAAKTRYAYRMEGFDAQWQQVGAQRSASYTNLAPGRYTFRVRASNGDGVWNEEGASVRLVITPPVWQTWWFRVLALAAVAAAVHRWVRFQQRRREELRRQKDYLERSVGRIVRGMDRLSSGDLTVRLDVTEEDEIGRIATGFNHVVEEIRGIIGEVNDAVHATVAASQEIHAGTEGLSASARAQAERTSEVASAAQELSASAATTARSMAEAAEIARRSRAAAAEGGQVAIDTIVGMGRIVTVVEGSAAAVTALGTSAERIGSISRVIDDIAAETNLLALNAAIEAARVGEHGRGFAVVAGEVRTLATRTAEATRDIAQMINEIQRETRRATGAMDEVTGEVRQGTVLVDRAGEALHSIIGSSEQVLARIQQVSAAGEAQAATSSQISETIEANTRLARTAAAENGAIARASQELSGLLGSLQLRVARFRLAVEEAA